MERRIRISVRNLVEFILRSGDIDNRKGQVGDKDAMQEGSRIHRKIQGRMGSNYRPEVALSIEMPGEGYTLVVEGRADGIFYEENEIGAEETEQTKLFYSIDEIKGVYRDVNLMQEPVPVHLAQAKCYAYIYANEQNLSMIGVQMTYCNIETEEIRRFQFVYTFSELEIWFYEVADAYHKWARMEQEWRSIRQESITDLQFPFEWREGQKEVASSVYRTMLRKKKLFIQAPTGTGKTLSTLYPAVKAVGAELAERIFYTTAKTVTRTVAEEAFRLMKDKGLRMKTITLTAKEKICFCETTECNPEACPYAKGHFDRVNDAVFEFVSTSETYDRAAIVAQAEKWQVCPFEFSLDVSLWADAIICDYNYVFDPRAKLKRFFAEGVKGEYLFLIDEAHNLVERGREMFSASLYKEDFLALKREIKPYSKKLERALARCNSWLLERKRECDTVQVLEDVGTFPIYLMNLCGVMEDFLDNSQNHAVNEKILELYFELYRFLDTVDRLDENYLIYTELCEDGRFLIRLYCIDVSKNLQECLDKGKSTIYFSATFLPIQYYKQLLSTETDNYAIYARSSFDPARQKILIGTDTTSRYTSRSPEEYRKMADYILTMVRARRGNYMAFFSSYRMMEDVAEQFSLMCEENDEKIQMILQESGMKEEAREAFLQTFETHHEDGLIGFCVMGGIFGEGIDLKSERLIGALVIGTGLPQVCRERELLKQFYDRRGEDGFFYAYLCPGMNKVLQSAGRVIRTEEDCGVIALLDERFAAGRYRQMFPHEWKNVEFCTRDTVGQKARAFWEQWK